jgi:alcohol dehydrogenase class IV
MRDDVFHDRTDGNRADLAGASGFALRAMTPFTHDALGGRVVFGAGSRTQLGTEVDATGAQRVVLIAAEEEDALGDELAAVLGHRLVGRFSDVVQHVPVAKAKAATEIVDATRADCVVTVGGGSATGFGKAVRLARSEDRQVGGLSFVAVPTTYAGSEMTPIWGRTDGDHKATGKLAYVKPDIVIYDPELTLTLPPRIAGPSGMNALAHCIEALYGPGANPIVSLHALDGIRALIDGLPRVCGAGDNLEARGDVLYGAYLAGIALAVGGTALHHKTCHVLGGMFNLNHGDMNAVVLGHAVAYNADAMPAVMAQLGQAVGVPPAEVPGTLFDLAVTIGAPTSLESIGMPADGLDDAARRITIEAADNIREPDETSIRDFLRRAFEGLRP